MAAAVLSLNGKPQVALRPASDGSDAFTQEQVAQAGSGNSAAAVTVGDATQEVMKLLGASVRVKISDGRIVLGRFHCFDKHQNVILKDAREYPPLRARAPVGKGKDKRSEEQVRAEEAEEEARFATGTGRPMGGRALGMVLVPGKHLVYMKVLSRAL